MFLRTFDPVRGNVSWYFPILQHLQPTSSQSEVLDFVVEVVPVHVEDDADVEDEEGDQQVGDVCSWPRIGCQSLIMV